MNAAKRFRFLAIVLLAFATGGVLGALSLFLRTRMTTTTAITIPIRPSV